MKLSRLWPFRRRQADDPLGVRGERIARKFLRGRGMKILGANYRCPSGEADLIALDTSTRRVAGAETIVFVEVKTRASDRSVDPQSAVDDDKQRRLRRVAAYYMGSRDTRGFALRFDVIAIVAPDGQEPRIEHIPDAFR